MARRSNSFRAGRDTSDIAKWRYLPLSQYVAKPLSVLRLFEDRRFFHPEGVQAPARSFTRLSHRLEFRAGPLRVSYRPTRVAMGLENPYPSWKIGFVKPKEVLICVRRRIRRQVMHAFKIAGRSGLGGPRYNAYSKVSC